MMFFIEQRPCAGNEHLDQIGYFVHNPVGAQGCLRIGKNKFTGSLLYKKSDLLLDVSVRRFQQQLLHFSRQISAHFCRANRAECAQRKASHKLIIIV
jgi:hypothetical protein